MNEIATLRIVAQDKDYVEAKTQCSPIRADEAPDLQLPILPKVATDHCYNTQPAIVEYTSTKVLFETA
ncbi:hypothetical protein AMS68_007700 [Peltaster fructicola]|uniref:Uncharacterized protein n=1 Tax=Peltaster fructicola TaxID=286661 RepID=A0A6H0Y5A5_9PEZI|nr:hypothetical protein AMS68_007700 [Peltaster fructicola]